MGTEVVGTFTHADSPQWGPPTAPASRMRFSRFAIDTHMKLFFAGATHAGQIYVREQIHMTLKTPLNQNSDIASDETLVGTSVNGVDR
jgi:hypothetical protein